MRAFSDKQTDVFLNAFGEPITYGASTFRAILNVRPVVIEGTEGLIEDEETFLSAKSIDISALNLSIGSQLIVRGTDYTVYRIYNDLSGVIEIYIRVTIAGLIP